MEKLFILLCAMSVATAFFLPPLLQGLKPKENNLSNICVYSADPSKFQPKCFLCPNNAFTNILKACTTSASIPHNVTYSQADCLQQNCAINYPPTTKLRLRRHAAEGAGETVELTPFSADMPTVPLSEVQHTMTQRPQPSSTSGVESTTLAKSKRETGRPVAPFGTLATDESVSYYRDDDENDDDVSDSFEEINESNERDEKILSESDVQERVVIDGKPYTIVRHEVLYALGDGVPDF